MTIPQHIAIVMDGNARWAKLNGVTVSSGHQKGADVVKQTALSCKKLGVNYLTVYAFSSENWNRPKSEVTALMSLFRRYLKKDVKELMKENVRIRFIGNRSQMDKDLQELMTQVEKDTAHNKFQFIIAMSYGSREEIRAAAFQFANDSKSNVLKPEDFDKYLYTSDIPDPDLFIRTSGEYRISNFLLWQLSYSELYFTDVLWPDFSEQHLIEAMQEYANRERRYGLR
jgi:undecaprenyl diphosphate synthase